MGFGSPSLMIILESNFLLIPSLAALELGNVREGEKLSFTAASLAGLLNCHFHLLYVSEAGQPSTDPDGSGTISQSAQWGVPWKQQNGKEAAHW